MEIKSWNDLKEFANSLTAEQLKQRVFAYPDDEPRLEITEVFIEEEAYYLCDEISDEGYFKISDVRAESIEGNELEEAIPAGSIFVHVE